jgi:protoporphyrinogen oxidase
MRTAVVGGGMLGMTVAWRAVQAGHDVTIFEGAERCGGLAAPWQLGDVVWDRHYHVTLYSDLALRALLLELGLEDEMQWVTTQTGFYVDGVMYPFSGLIDYLRFPPLSITQKARLGATILEASRIVDWRPLERLTAVEWLTKKSGRKTVERIWLPLLRAKLGPYAERASAAFIWAIIARMYAARRSGMKSERFGYVRGGYETVLRRFERRLAERGVTIETSCRVERVEPRSDGFDVATERALQRFDRVVVTLVPPLASRLVPALDEREHALCAGIEYQGIICASLLGERGLTPYYITNIADSSVPFTAVIEMTALVDRSTFNGKSLIYLPKYVAPNDPAFKTSDEEFETVFLAALGRMHPSFSRDDVRAFKISRVPYVFPVPTVGYSDRLPPMQTSIPGLIMASSAHIVNGTLNVNETVKLANGVSDLLLASSMPARSVAAV